MVAVSRDPLLLNWEKLTGQPVIPFGAEDEALLPHGVFDPCIWSSDGTYYALSAGIIPCRPDGKHVATEYLFRSRDLEAWEYLHTFIEGDRFTVLGDDGACPYFWPIGDRHNPGLLQPHERGSILARRLRPEARQARGRCARPVQLRRRIPGRCPRRRRPRPDGEGGVIVLFNMNAGKPVRSMSNYLSGFFRSPGRERRKR